MNQVATLGPSRLPLSPSIAKAHNLEAGDWRVLVEQVFPAAKSPESIFMALAYCKARGLDIYKRPVHIVPMWSSEKRAYVETVWPGIAEIRTTAARTGAYAGIDDIVFGQMIERSFSGRTNKGDVSAKVSYPEFAKATVYRLVKGHRVPFTATVWWEEAYATVGKTDVPNDMWCKRPRGQLAKCAEAAAIRMAFPEEVGNDLTAEEMEGHVIDHVSHETTERTAIKAPPPPAAIAPPPPTPTPTPTPTPSPTPPEQDPPPPPPTSSPSPAPAPTSPPPPQDDEPETETPAEIIERARRWFGNCQDAADVETLWSEFEHHMEEFDSADAEKLRLLHEEAMGRFPE
jgi:phage recombination protein Bet